MAVKSGPVAVAGLRLHGFPFSDSRVVSALFFIVTRVTLVLFPSGAKYPQYFAGAVATSAPDVI